MDEEIYLSPKDTLARLVRLETKLCVKFEEMDKALVLARELAATNLEVALRSLNERLEAMNEFRRQLERQEATFLKRADLEHELDASKELRESTMGALESKISGAIKGINSQIAAIEKMVYIGFGVLLATQVAFHVFWKG